MRNSDTARPMALGRYRQLYARTRRQDFISRSKLCAMTSPHRPDQLAMLKPRSSASEVLPKSPMAEAITYVPNNWRAFSRYTEADSTDRQQCCRTRNERRRMCELVVTSARNKVIELPQRSASARPYQRLWRRTRGLISVRTPKRLPTATPEQLLRSPSGPLASHATATCQPPLTASTTTADQLRP